MVLRGFWLLLLCISTAWSNDIPWRYPAAERLVAIGDLHGDLNATRKALRIGGLIDAQDNWVGGKTVVVQTGDQTDRGDQERAIIDLLERLQMQAKAAGGAIHVLNGNHELMNAALDFRYVTEGGYQEFQPGIKFDTKDPRLAKLPEHQKARAAAFLPGGPYAQILAKRNTIVVVGDTVFVHGGVLPALIDQGIGTFNDAVRAWLRGERDRPESVRGKASPVWSRHFSADVEADDCALLAQSLKKLGLKRMVVSHTVQNKINPACDEGVWRIDVGMAAHYGGQPAVLEIVGDQVRVLSEKP